MTDWYDRHLELHGMQPENVVGWQMWYSNRAVHSSLDTRSLDLPRRDGQALSLYRKRTDGKQGLWRLTLVGLNEYRIPNSKMVVQGDWTPLENHDAVAVLAAESWLDH